MRTKLVLVVLVLLAVAGCGSAKRPPTTAAVLSEQAAGTLPCNPARGKGVMGVCTPPSSEPTRAPPLTAAGARLIPDVSEFQACRVFSEVIFRAYEAGTEREDVNARCHAAEARRLKVWDAAYAFLRPGHGGCVYQANRTVAIVRSIGGVVGPIIADAEVWLPPGFVSCFDRVVQRAGFVAIDYTAPGTWPGGAFTVRVWVAAYPFRPPCFLNACPYVAHQFSEATLCRGVFGDCSVNEGILSIRSVKPKPLSRRELEARLRSLNRLLGAYDAQHTPHGHNCQHPPFKHAYPSARFNHACGVWAGEARAAAAALR